ncbi:cuticle protein LPCP-23 [Papilio machaon]|uniref:cuticle protein LPCP-23 n=1 Tax=Papilio machaon TaxID=76193 RepID=UPI001E66411E|nr:cuticle protein LPCP-23 [Papilio machaon]
MKLLVVFSALAAVACASLIPLAQPSHYGAAFVTHAAIAPVVAPAVVAAPAAVSHQSRVDVRTSPAIVTAHSAYATPLLGHSALGFGHGHLLKKRSLGHVAYAAPVITHAAPVIAAVPAAVSHQSRVDVRTSPAIVTAHTVPVLAAHNGYAAPLLGHLLKKRSLGHIAYAAPVVAHTAPVIATAPVAVSQHSRVDVVSSPAVVSHTITAPAVAHTFVAPVVARAAYAPVVAHAITPAAVSHQSRVDVRTRPAVVSQSVVAAPILGAHSSLTLSGHGHLLKKRSLGHIITPVAVAHAPAAVTHQSRVDVVSRPAVVSHSVVSPVVSHAVPVVPLAHSASRLLHASPLVHIIKM